jgi:hypothetical protein
MVDEGGLGQKEMKSRMLINLKRYSKKTLYSYDTKYLGATLDPTAQLPSVELKRHEWVIISHAQNEVSSNLQTVSVACLISQTTDYIVNEFEWT